MVLRATTRTFRRMGFPAVRRTFASLCRVPVARVEMVGGACLRLPARMNTDHHPSIQTTDTPPALFEAESIALLEMFENVLEEDHFQDLVDDINCSDGVLSVSIVGHGTWVINKHSHTRQVWMSSPKSGPNKYNYHEGVGKWLGERDRHSFHDRLQGEFSAVFGQEVKFDEEF